MSSRINRQDRDRKRKFLIKCTMLIIIALLVIGLIYKVGQNFSTMYNRRHMETEVVQYGCLEDILQGEGLVLRKELTIKAPADGHFENVVSEREKVARHVLVGYFIRSGNKIPMRAPQAGIFTRQVDGLEAALSDINLKTVGNEVFKYKATSPLGEEEIKADQGIYKIVNNLVPSQLLIHFPLDGLNLKIAKQQTVDLTVNGKAFEHFKVLDYKKEHNELVLLLESNGFIEELLNQRLVRVEMRLNSSKGYLIHEKSLVKKGKEKGIYCTKGENIVFKAVKVLDQKDDIAVVEGLEATDLVIKNPERIKHNL